MGIILRVLIEQLFLGTQQVGQGLLDQRTRCITQNRGGRTLPRSAVGQVHTQTGKLDIDPHQSGGNIFKITGL